jgi:hypothetical protein
MKIGSDQRAKPVCFMFGQTTDCGVIETRSDAAQIGAALECHLSSPALRPHQRHLLGIYTPMRRKRWSVYGVERRASQCPFAVCVWSDFIQIGVASGAPVRVRGPANHGSSITKPQGRGVCSLRVPCLHLVLPATSLYPPTSIRAVSVRGCECAPTPGAMTKTATEMGFSICLCNPMRQLED